MKKLKLIFLKNYKKNSLTVKIFNLQMKGWSTQKEEDSAWCGLSIL